MAQPTKDTIYVDIDDEITGIIEKLNSSSGKIVALVLPKRAAVLQSIVNMKLLKRAAEKANKNIVLITTEAGLLPLAGAVGLHVAKTLASKPEIPLAPNQVESDEPVDAAESDAESDDELLAAASTATVGSLAGAAAVSRPNDDVETVELDDDTTPASLAPKTFDPPQLSKKDKKKLKKDNKLKVPNFERFRVVLILGAVLIVALIIGGYFAATVLPKASIAVSTDASSVNANLNLNLSTSATVLDTTQNLVPAKQVQEAKTYTQTAAATGQKNSGTRATGSVTFVNCDTNDRLSSQSETIPAGTGISANGITYITQNSVNVPPSDFKSDKTCRQNNPSNPVDVVAQSGGTASNTSANVSFSVAYSNPSDGTKSFSATSTDGVSGGTDNITKVVSQADIDSAKAKISTTDTTVKQALQNQLTQQGYQAIAATYAAAPAATASSSSQPGDTADTVTVTESVTYSMLGAKQADLKTLVDQSVKNQIDTTKQNILSEGLDAATFSAENATSTGAQLTMQTVVTAGPELSTGTIAAQAAGKKTADVQSTLETNPDVKDVTIKLSPFWVTTVPKKASKITVTIAKPTVQSQSGNNSASTP